jgi:DNA polymerase-3 subunit delta
VPPRPRAKGQVVAPDDLTAVPVALVTGPEEVLAERAVAAYTTRVREADPDVGVERLDAAGYEPGQLDQVAGPSLFGGGTLVLVTGLEATGEAFAADVTAYLTDPSPSAWVLLRHAGGQRGKAMLEAIRASGAPEVVCAAITKDEDKVEFATEEFRRLGRRAAPQALRALVDAVGSDLRELQGACRQLADMLPEGARIEVDVIDEWFGGRVEVTGFRVADAAVAGRGDQALALLRHALATGADPVPLVAAVAAKIRAMAKVSAVGRGRSADLAGALALAPWQIDRARRDLTQWNQEGLARAVLALAEADTSVKGGGRDPVYAVERALLVIASSRGA